MRKNAFLQLAKEIRQPLYSAHKNREANDPKNQILFCLIEKIQNDLVARNKKSQRAIKPSQYQLLVDYLRLGGGYGFKLSSEDADACIDIRDSFGEAKRGNGETFVAALSHCIWDHNPEWGLFHETFIQPEELPLEQWLIAAVEQLERLCVPDANVDSKFRKMAAAIETQPSKSASVCAFLEAAERGSVSGMNNLGFALQNGIGIKTDHREAFRWYLAAATGGNPAGMNNIGFCYQNGVGTEIDLTEAARWYAKAVQKGNPDAMNNMGFCFQEGLGVEQNIGQAFAWYYASAARGSASGMNNLGFFYQQGWGTRQNFSEALAWYRKAAAHGKAGAMHSIGYLYHHGMGVPVDFGEAERWYAKARDAGHPDALNSLGFLFEQRHLKNLS